MSTLTRDGLAAYFASIGWADLNVDADHGKCPNCYHDGAAYRAINGHGEIAVDCSNCSAPIAEHVRARLDDHAVESRDTGIPDAADAAQALTELLQLHTDGRSNHQDRQDHRPGGASQP